MRAVYDEAMSTAAAIAVAVVAALHLWFLVLEMFLWQRPFGLKTFKQRPEQAAATAVLASNQGLYNGFLSAGLLFTLWRGDPITQLFFLGCVVVAGVFGAATASRAILFFQAIPGAIAFALVWLAR
jgi:putative membrane protein